LAFFLQPLTLIGSPPFFLFFCNHISRLSGGCASAPPSTRLRPLSPYFLNAPFWLDALERSLTRFDCLKFFFFFLGLLLDPRTPRPSPEISDVATFPVYRLPHGHRCGVNRHGLLPQVFFLPPQKATGGRMACLRILRLDLFYFKDPPLRIDSL